jgi:putative PIN family toxin of toxin-antitoxin system
MQKKYYAVIDTNVFISALLKIESYPGIIIREVLNENIVLLINEDILNEYREVMSRPKFAFEKNMIDEFLEILEQYIIYVKATKTKIEFTDIKDKVFYEIYKSCELKEKVYLITGNLKHFPNEKNIMNPKDFVEQVLEAK